MQLSGNTDTGTYFSSSEQMLITLNLAWYYMEARNH